MIKYHDEYAEKRRKEKEEEFKKWYEDNKVRSLNITVDDDPDNVYLLFEVDKNNNLYIATEDAYGDWGQRIKIGNIKRFIKQLTK